MIRSLTFCAAFTAAAAVWPAMAESLPKRNPDIQMAIDLDAHGKTDEAKSLLDSHIKAHPGDLEAIVALGNIERGRNRFAECAETYSKGVAAVRSPTRTNWTLFYFRGICYERSNAWPKAEADLKKALELYPDQPNVLNYLGYSWVDRGIHLDDALKMIERSVEQEPDNGYIVDSLGWAHFKLGHIEEAERQLSRAVKLVPTDAAIRDHYAAVLLKLGRPRSQSRPFEVWVDQFYRVYLKTAAISPDGKRLIVGGNNLVAIRDVASGRQIKTDNFGFGVSAVAFSFDGSLFASGSSYNTVRIWDATSMREVKTLRFGEPVESIAFTPAGNILVGFLQSMELWDVTANAKLMTFKTPEDEFSLYTHIAVSADGKTIFSGGGSRITFWDLATGRKVKTFETSSRLDGAMTMSPDGRLVAYRKWNGVQRKWNGVEVLDARSGRSLRMFDNARSVAAVAFSRDGTALITGGDVGDTEGIKLWDVSSGRLIRTLKRDSVSLGVVAIVASPDGEKLFTAGDNLFAWDMPTGQFLADFNVLGNFDLDEWVTLVPEGFFDASSPKAAQNLRIRRDNQDIAIDQFYDALYRPDLVREKLAGDPRGLVRKAAERLDLDKALATGAPPQVAIASPAAAQTVSTEQLAVEARLTDQGGGIGRVEWRLNGTTVGVETAPPGQTVTVRHTLALASDKNTIQIIAYNAQGVIASAPAQIVVTLQAQEPKGAPHLYVLAVGVNDYWDSRLRLAFAVPDAQAIGDALEQGGKGLYESVDVKLLLDAGVNAAGLEQAFTELARKVRPQDVFVLFMSGHGKTVDGRFYFLPQNFHYAGEGSIARAGIGQDQLQRWLALIQARKSVLMFDSCESGTLTEDLPAQRGLQRVEEVGTAIDRLTRATGRTVLTATTDDKPAAEGVGGHGVFTYALLEGFGRAQADADGMIGVTELAAFVDRAVPEISYRAFKIRQVPERRIVGANFPLAHKTEDLIRDDGQSAVALPTKPTHVVIASVKVRQTASDTGPVVVELTPGTQVRLIEASGGWDLVARDGKKLGYIDAKALLMLQ